MLRTAAMVGAIALLLGASATATYRYGINAATPAAGAPTPQAAATTGVSGHAPLAGPGRTFSGGATPSGSTTSTTPTKVWVSPAHPIPTVPSGSAAPRGLAAPTSTSRTSEPATGSTTTQLAPAAASVSAVDGNLRLDGANHTFVGLNAYEAATNWSTNYGCGGQLTDSQLNQLFGSLPPGNLFRIWAFQGSMALGPSRPSWNFGALDRVVTIAGQHQQYVILSLTDEAGTCDDQHWKGPAWYAGGYGTIPLDAPPGHAVASYLAYVTAIVNHFHTNPTVAMWEPVNEPEASTCDPGYQGSGCGGHNPCPNETQAAADLRSFFDTVGGLIHRLDPSHLVEEGLMGGGQCGASGTDYTFVGASAEIDVLSYHDYSPGAMPGDQWNGLAQRIVQARSLAKPLIVGEMGMVAGTVPGCPSLAQRAASYSQKIKAQSAAGVAAILLWDWVPNPAHCDYDIAPGDPALAALPAAVN